MTRTDQTGICTEKSLIEVAKDFGLKGYIKENSSLSELKTITDKNIPIIVDWNSPEEGGHYSVVVGLEDNNIFLADPHFGEIKKYDAKWFEEKWVDSFEGREIYREIVVIYK